MGFGKTLTVIAHIMADAERRSPNDQLDPKECTHPAPAVASPLLRGLKSSHLGK